ncbi:sensor histidine kinase [Sinanaerobacter chloroacetimidivorans]|jgi:two-component sensor histidine kinase|uniref:histidine kinase n=1 Tax=Sinanaerobacter chloroacetimidivorans TaxID=2818044 RepID=A0A8J8B3L1_9FIRM|nr:PAS domain-containing sensor histidine kinase [Sinanaerobacter chloroacetimidivorans]MBR0599872.1 histidine kinase N-terminal domain-containing protein [Sinanaerobacter chloroacetimidivorans]
MKEIMKELCKDYTNLSEEDIAILIEFGEKIDAMSMLTSNDIFIDALTANGEDSVVLAWARPEKKSLYNKSVVGDLAYRENEPGVYKTMKTGEISRAIRGVSQEGVPIAQTVVPIKNGERIIGVLIMERDITLEIEQEQKVNDLKVTLEFLKKSLIELNIAESYFADWFNNGIFVLNRECRIIYTNKAAHDLYVKGGAPEPMGNDLSRFLGSFHDLDEMLEEISSPTEIGYMDEVYSFHIHPLGLQDDLEGAVIIVQDMTELRIKEREIQGKDILIREIHHRVKNNLQNIAAILQLQMRRTNSEEARNAFTASINRIMSIAIAHNVFSRQNIDKIVLKDLLSYILNATLENFKLENQNIMTAVEGHNIVISSTQAIPVSLIANEVISNSMKHGIKSDEAGEIRINIKENNGKVCMEFYDSGKHELHYDINDENKLGLQIVKALSQEQLGGSFTIGKENGETKAEIIFAK